jgi:polysaccharide biosynthesis protein PslH
MKILLLTQVLPYPADSGPKIKTFNLLRQLAERHDVHLVTFVRSEAEERAAQAMREWCPTVDTVQIHRSRLRDVVSLGTSLVRGTSFLVERDDSDEFRSKIERLCRQFSFDAVHADQLTMGQFAVDLPIPLRVLDEHNAVWTIVRRAAQHEGRGIRRLLAEREWRKLKAYEGSLCRAFDRVLVVSDEDRNDLETAAKAGLRTSVVPIAVDTQELPFSPPSESTLQILSMATMFYPPNVEGVDWFARQVFPLVRQQAPDAQFVIVGSRPPAHIQQLAAGSSGIDVTGYVKDLDPYIRQSALLVVPLHSGSGMRVKILEAFARGIPVVSTTIGVEGIDARHSEHLLVADTPADFAQAVLDVLRNPTAAATRAAEARRLVERQYDRRQALAALETIYPSTSVAESGPQALGA